MVGETSRSISGTRKARRLLFPRYRASSLPQRNRRPDSYDQKYREDAQGTELGEDARVWKVYCDEAAKFDTDLIARWRDDLDVLMVVAGLFSAIVTAFAMQFYQDVFRPDYGRMTVTLLALTLNHTLVSAGQAPITLDPSLKLSDIAHYPSPGAIALTSLTLLFLSLAIALGTTVTCIVVKQWLDHYTSSISAAPRTAALLRHHRLLGLQKWRVAGFVHSLPYILGIAIFLCMLGTISYEAKLSPILAGVVCLFSLPCAAFVGMSSILPLYYPDCPYVTPATSYFLWIRYLIAPTQAAAMRAREYAREFTFGQHFSPHEIYFRLAEAYTVHHRAVDLAAKALSWLRVVGGEPETRVTDIILQSLGGDIGEDTAQISGSIHARLLETSNLHKDALSALKHWIKPWRTPHNSSTFDELEDMIQSDKEVCRLYRACQTFAQIDELTRKELDALLHKPSTSTDIPISSLHQSEMLPGPDRIPIQPSSDDSCCFMQLYPPWRDGEVISKEPCITQSEGDTLNAYETSTTMPQPEFSTRHV